MIIEIAEFIAVESGFVRGTTIQVAHRTPDSPDRCSVVLESVGGPVHYDLPDRIDMMIQVISRAVTYMDARADSYEIYKSLFPDLSVARNVPIGSMPITAVAPRVQNYIAMSITPLAAPQYIGQDEKKRYEFSCNYIFRMQNA